jgi:hypothetical protein
MITLSWGLGNDDAKKLLNISIKGSITALNLQIKAETPGKPAISWLNLPLLLYLRPPVKKPGIILCHLTLLNN